MHFPTVIIFLAMALGIMSGPLAPTHDIVTRNVNITNMTFTNTTHTNTTLATGATHTAAGNGICTFHIRLYEYCLKNGKSKIVREFLPNDEGRDAAGEHCRFHFDNKKDDATWRHRGVGPPDCFGDFSVGPVRSAHHQLFFTYNTCWWWHYSPTKCGTCMDVGDWTEGPMDCKKRWKSGNRAPRVSLDRKSVV